MRVIGHGRRTTRGTRIAGLGADPEIVDALVDLNGVSTRIVGVMPEGFGFPVFGKLWLPVNKTEFEPQEGETNYVAAYAKLRPGGLSILFRLCLDPSDRRHIRAHV